MNEHYFHVLARGLSGALERLGLDEALDHLGNHLSQLLLDPSVAGCYITDLSRRPEIRAHRQGLQTLAWLLEKRLALDPFDGIALHTLGQTFGRTDCAALAEALRDLDREPEGLADVRTLQSQGDGPETEPVLRTLLKAYPGYVQAADLLLRLDFLAGRAPGDWLKLLRCPVALQGLWSARLFAHHALLGRAAEAAGLWESLPPSLRNAHLENLAAEVFVRQGQTARGRELYAASLARDPRQAPVRLRLNELDNPSPLRPGLLRQRQVVVCIYSFNKAPVLEATLCSLAATDLGAARLRLLLNGCTDRSREVAEAARKLFPNNDFQVLDLPINVGAPAARNWLAALPECREADYVAYIDDDVELGRDWLARLVSVLEEAPDAGVAGCKVLYPGRPAELQYLYRNVALARPDLFKLSLHAPAHTPDSGVYDYTRRTMSVMGCCHVLRGRMLRELPGFDIRFSPSQVDDLDHDLTVCLADWGVLYCGLTACVHLQNSGASDKSAASLSQAQVGNVIGNDIKLCAKHAGNLERLRDMALADRGRAESGADWRGRA